MTTQSSPPSIAALAWRQTLRDFRAGELRLLAVAVMLAVAALTAVGFFADRLGNGLQRDARQLLGGDAVVGSDRPAPPELTAQAQALGLRVAHSAAFPSMGRAPDDKGGASRLVAVKAVSPSYPLRGKLQLREAPGSAVQVVAAAPQPGTVWVDAALLDALQLQVGDPLLLGDARLTIARIIVIEPDRGAGFSSFAPRVMLAEADLPATGLIQPASRVNYRLAVAAPDGLTAAKADAAVRSFTDFVETRIKSVPLRGTRVESLQSGRPEMRQTLDRAEKFLNLVALLSALLSAVAVGIAAREFAARHLDDCAMLRVLGLSQRRIAGAYALEFGLLGLVASAAGVLLGLLVHNVFVWLLAGLVRRGAARAQPLAGVVWPGRGHDAVAGLRPATGAAVGACAAAARDPARRGRAQGRIGHRVAGRGGWFCSAADGGVFRCQAGRHRGGRLCGRRGRVCAAGLGVGAPAQGGGARQRGAALADAGHAADRGAAGLCGAAGQRAGRGPAGAGAAGAAAHRSDQQLAQGHAAGCAQSLRHQPAARAGQAFQARLARPVSSATTGFPMIRGRLVAINDKPVTSDTFAEERRQPPGRARVQPQPQRRRTGAQQIVAGTWVAGRADGLSVEEGLAHATWA
jgi:putative ABC transport system permease protein